MLEDKVLIWRFNHGRPEVLHEIYDTYKRDLLTLATSLLGDLTVAEDVVHDVFLSLLKLSGRLKVTGSLKGYLTTCVVNGARNIIRAHRRHPTGDLDEFDPIPTEADKPEDAAVIEEELGRLEWALGQLPYPQKEVLSLRVYGHMPFKEIARQQGVSTNTALGRYRYAIDRLRSLLNSEVRR